MKAELTSRSFCSRLWSSIAFRSTTSDFWTCRYRWNSSATAFWVFETCIDTKAKERQIGQNLRIMKNWKKNEIDPRKNEYFRVEYKSYFLVVKFLIWGSVINFFLPFSEFFEIFKHEPAPGNTKNLLYAAIKSSTVQIVAECLRSLRARTAKRKEHPYIVKRLTEPKWDNGLYVLCKY